MTTALVVSRYFPFDTRKVHGVYQRLGLQVRALGQVARRVECLFLVESDRRYAEAERALQEERLRGLWSPAVRLRLAPVARETAGELAEGCVQLLRDAGAAAALGKAARARAERAYDRRAVVERRVRLFGNALGTRSRQ
jgi:hypothetical protein